MAILKALTWNHINIPDAYIKLITPAESQSATIVLAVYANKESRDAGESPLYNIMENVPFEIHKKLFSEEALRGEGITARSQSYLYIKTLPDYIDCEDV
ncbi:MAG: hypothetical protein WC748_09945 [Legionellales bacterium]|jgi:hypothetical protein